MKNIIENRTFDEERALYSARDTLIRDCTFDGPADGESAIKECRNIEAENCIFKLRYPFWHNINTRADNITMEDTCRAAFWYCDGLHITDSDMHGIKALRECKNIEILNSKLNSSECLWFCDYIIAADSSISGEYAFFKSKNIKLTNVSFKGKYSFQYTDGITIENSVVDTKDAFWHSDNVTVKNCEVKGEYLGWYSKNLTLIDCVISGTQPLCYAENLTLINCEMHGCDFSFEYSSVNADITTEIMSVKNPISGRINAPSIGELIIDEYRRDIGNLVINEHTVK